MEYRGKHVFFLGIAGIGVSALARLALARGARVSGADPLADARDNPAVKRLLAGGVDIFRQHRAANLAPDVELVVASAAVPADNPELAIARQRNVLTVSRADFLGMLMAAHGGPTVAVAGTHGKTTTTAMIGVMLQSAGLDPTVLVGGEVAQLGGNIRIGSAAGPFVAEACEAYDSFLSLRPEIAVITNVEADHLDHYGTFEGVLDGFVRFGQNVQRRNGHLVVCADDAGIASIEERLLEHIPVDRYGMAHGLAGARAVSLADDISYGQITTFRLHVGLGAPGVQVRLRVPGTHNVYNALAAAAVGSILHLTPQQIADGLAEFDGATRRQERLGEIGAGDGGIVVIDDYAHHPTEIRATLLALRQAYPDRRLAALFQPHLYSRTRDFLADFGSALSGADLLIVTDIYGARESPIPGVRADEIVVHALRHCPRLHAEYVPHQSDIPGRLASLARAGDITVFMGAGDIRAQGEAFLRHLTDRARIGDEQRRQEN